jgi:hypothetical protein
MSGPGITHPQVEEEEESNDGLCGSVIEDRTTAPVPKWEILAGNRDVWASVWVQLC